MKSDQKADGKQIDFIHWNLILDTKKLGFEEVFHFSIIVCWVWDSEVGLSFWSRCIPYDSILYSGLARHSKSKRGRQG